MPLDEAASVIAGAVRVQPLRDAVERWCRRCRYPLPGAAAGVCPECGTRFNASDPASFRTRWNAVRRLPFSSPPRTTPRLDALICVAAAGWIVLASAPGGWAPPPGDGAADYLAGAFMQFLGAPLLVLGVLAGASVFTLNTLREVQARLFWPAADRRLLARRRARLWSPVALLCVAAALGLSGASWRLRFEASRPRMTAQAEAFLRGGSSPRLLGTYVPRGLSRHRGRVWLPVRARAASLTDVTTHFVYAPSSPPTPGDFVEAPMPGDVRGVRSLDGGWYLVTLQGL